MTLYIHLLPRGHISGPFAQACAAYASGDHKISLQLLLDGRNREWPRVQLAIDDFGTGYSSLNALKTFPVARRKIDRSFISNLAANDSDKAVAGAVISLGQKLNMRVIAEDIETAEQVEFLRANNCDKIPGYHISRSVRPEAIVDFLKSQFVTAL